MSSDLVIVLTAGLTATACGLLGPFLVLRRNALMSDAVAHAVLPGIVVAFLIFQTRAPLPIVAGAAVFGIICVLGIDALRSTGLVKWDVAIALVFPALFALGVIGISTYASGVHLDLDSTIYGEIAFAPFLSLDVLGAELPRTVVLSGAAVAANLTFVALLWRKLKTTSFDPQYAQAVAVSPARLSRMLLVAVAITAVISFESVGAILVVALLIVPAAAAHLLTDRLTAMIGLTVAIGWVSALGGYTFASAADASIAGMMGVVAAGCFALALLAGPRYGLAARAVRRRRAARRARALLGAAAEARATS
ncbi:MAG TPA: metal ABC transporter permease [Solirubrobacteraceae bacterium]|nr:metal ABC transporter permease [Solirubrobacteraceae bacterium]